MSTFREGWWETHFDPRTRDRRAAYFVNPNGYIAECDVLATGLQILLWSGTTPRAKAWSADMRWMPPAEPGDWWDKPPVSVPVSLPDASSRAKRQPTPRELCQQAASADPNLAHALSCSKEIHVGLFFDGTNNNMERDRPKRGHSNVVSLFDAHKGDQAEYFRYYMPGVGTPFPEIGEMGESPGGNKFSSGGEARIHWGLLQVFNAVCRATTTVDLIGLARMKDLCTSVQQLATWWRLGDDKLVVIFRKLQQELLSRIESVKPKVLTVNVSVFGFSRGAAEARTFCNWLQLATGGTVGFAHVRLRFLGIFDTVASVGLADSSPVGQGFMDWADGTMVTGNAEKVVHYVAAHEIRQSFPSSLVRQGGAYAGDCKEFVYPGAHSDVGGGYEPDSQGKATQGRSALLSQIPLVDMYFEAKNAGVRLRDLVDLPGAIREDFKVHPDLDRAFSAYAAWSMDVEKSNVAADGGAPAETRMRRHMGLYWRWRASVSEDAKFKALSSYQKASAQGRQDLWESEQDWRDDVRRAQEADRATRERMRRMPAAPNLNVVPGLAPGVEIRPPAASVVELDLLREIALAHTVPAEVSRFFDNHVHDSHGGFWLLGPITAATEHDYIEAVKQKKAAYDRAMSMANDRRLDPKTRGTFYAIAGKYTLNRFEQKVLDQQGKQPGTMPLMTDGDAADMRQTDGWATDIALLRVLGTATRREPHGHGRYRRVFDKS